MNKIEVTKCPCCNSIKNATIEGTSDSGWGSQFEGTWWDMICFARNILANPNTKQCAPEWYHPEYANDNYCGEEIPYEYTEEGE